MAYFLVQDFKGGLDRRRMSVASTPGTLRTLINGHLNRGGEIESVAAWVKEFVLPENTFGLAASGGRVYVFGSEDVTLPDANETDMRPVYVRCQHPDGNAMTGVLSTTFFDGKPYVVARFDNGSIVHFYNGKVVPDFLDIRSRATFTLISGTSAADKAPSAKISFTGGDAARGASFRMVVLSATAGSITSVKVGGVELLKEKVTFASSASSYTIADKIIRSINGRSDITGWSAIEDKVTGSDDVTIKVTHKTFGTAQSNKAIAVVSNGITLNTDGTTTGGSAGAKITQISIDGIDLLTKPITYEGPETTAANIVLAINNRVTTPDYVAVRAAGSLTISTTTTGTKGNGRAVVLTKSGVVTFTADPYLKDGSSPASVTSIKVGGVEALSKTVPWKGSVDATVQAIADQVNGFVSDPDVIAEANASKLTLLSRAAPLTDEGYDIYVLGPGDENMIGANATVPDVVLDASDPRIFQWALSGGSSGSIIAATEPLAFPGAPAGVVGTGVAFARGLLSSLTGARKILLIPAAVATSQLVAGTTEWNYTGTTTAPVYDSALSTLIATLTAAMALPNARVRGILWDLGASDRLQAGLTVQQYRAAVLKIVEAIRARTGSTTPVVFMGINPDYAAGVYAGQWATLTSALSTISSYVTASAYVPCPSGVSVSGDEIHITAAGNRARAADAAAKMVSILEPVGQPVVIKTEGPISFDTLTKTMTPVGTSAQGSEYKPPEYVKTSNQKVYALRDSVVHFCKVNDPAIWRETEVGAGFVNMATSEAGSEKIYAIASYFNNLAFLSRRTIQIWFMDIDDAQNQRVQTISATGTLAPRSVVEFGENDVVFLSDSGIRSLRSRDSSNAAYTNDIGTAIDPIVVDEIRAAPAAAAAALAVVEPRDGRLLMLLNGKIYVFSFFPGSKVSGWSVYEPSFSISDFAVDGLVVLARSGNDIYSLGGYGVPVYDDTEVQVELPFLDAGKPATKKQWTGLDLACEGEWDVRVAFDPLHEADDVDVATVLGTTYGKGRVPMENATTFMSLRLTGRGAGRKVLSNIAIHFDETGEKT